MLKRILLFSLTTTLIPACTAEFGDTNENETKDTGQNTNNPPPNSNNNDDVIPVLCGNGMVDQDEDCDLANLDGMTCAGLGYSGGTLSCDGDCNFITDACTRCGNAVLEPGEDCDDGNTVGGDGCTATCLWEYGVCGNAVVEGPEECDKPDHDGETCASLGFAGGTLQCTDACLFDTSGCL